jgi:hypothetical protein
MLFYEIASLVTLSISFIVVILIFALYINQTFLQTFANTLIFYSVLGAALMTILELIYVLAANIMYFRLPWHSSPSPRKTNGSVQ